MARFEPLDAETVIEQLPHWTVAREGRAISRSFLFPDFACALAFMVRVGVQADKLDHHPEWRNVYNRVEVELTTHDADTVTTLDVALARLMDEAC